MQVLLNGHESNLSYGRSAYVTQVAHYVVSISLLGAGILLPMRVHRQLSPSVCETRHHAFVS
jgi:hypothetical protein